MRQRNRWFLALAFVGLWLLLPSKDSAADRSYLAHVQVRAWLLSESSPLWAWRQQERVPPLTTNLLRSPPIEDTGERQRQQAEYDQIVASWAAARTADGQPTVVDPARGALPLLVRVGSDGFQAELPQPAGAAATLLLPYADRCSLLPAFLAMALAVLTQRLLLALLAGCVAAAIALGLSTLPGQQVATLPALARAAPFFLCTALAVVFVFLTVGLLARNGGRQGLVAWLQRRGRGPVRAQLWALLGSVVAAFDSYAHCLLVGPALRPLCDASRVSREKLAYLVNATTATIASLAMVSLGSGFANVHAPLPLRCYCLFTVALLVMGVLMRRDFGPMLTAERRARLGLPSDGTVTLPVGNEIDRLAASVTPPPRARHAVWPWLLFGVGTIGGLLLTPYQSHEVLLAAAIAAWLCALGIARSQRQHPIASTTWLATRSLALPLVMLGLAWTFGQLSADLGTGVYLTTAVRTVTPVALPIVWFALAGAVAFATGSSLATLAILLPNVALMANQVGADANGQALALLTSVAVLEGAIGGRQSSPISDTTVLAAAGSQCTLMAHTKTQLPYALLAFATSLLCGYVPLVCFGSEVWPWCLLGGVLSMALVLRLLGRSPDALAT